MEAYNNASFGIHLNYGTYFKELPTLSHGIKGIFISHNVKVGKNCRIFQLVTIGEEKGGAPNIGDNCIIGAGCVVAIDIPDNATAIMQKTRIIVEEKN